MRCERCGKEQVASVPRRGARLSSSKPMAVHIMPSQEIYQEPRLRIDFLKERLEALIQDEKYEEAGRLCGQIKNLESTLKENHMPSHSAN